MSQPRLDLPQLDAQAANLHLMIETAQVFDNAVRPLYYLITGAIHSASRLPEGIGEKSFRRQVRATEVAPGQTDTGQIEFTGNTAGYWVEIGVQHMQLDVADRVVAEVEASQAGESGQRREVADPVIVEVEPGQVGK